MRKKKAVLNIISSLVLQLVLIVCGFIIPQLVIRKYGSNVNGLLSSITQFLAYITLIESGFGPVVSSILYKPIAHKDKSTIEKILKSSTKFFRTVSYIFLIYITVLSILYPLIVNKNFDYFYTFSLIIIISISIFAEYYSGMTYKLYLQAEQKTYITSNIQIIMLLLNTVITYILVWNNCSIHIVKLISSLIFIIRPLLQNYYVKKKYKINLNNISPTYKIEQKWDGLAQHIASVIHVNTDITVLTLLSKMTEVSVYSIYNIIVVGIKGIIRAFTGGIDAIFGNMIAKKELDKLNSVFDLYEIFYFTIMTIVFSCTIILITPFVKVYTYGINDVNYIRPLFGYLIVLAELMHAIRLPYSTIILAAGHFKETRRGAWIEAIVNIVISIILVINYGIIGVAIGTLIAMLIRTIEFIIHTSKNILERNIIISVKKIFIIIIEIVIIWGISSGIEGNNSITYMSWIIYSVKIFLMSSMVTLLINFVFYRKEVLSIFKYVLNRIKKEGKNYVKD